MRRMKLRYIPVKAFLQIDLFLDRISLEWDSRGSGMTPITRNLIIDLNASLDRNCLSLTKEKMY